jgi:hypothetical protein
VRGPPITIKCECGELRHVPYGERWECEQCGRRWNTAQIPAAEYDGIMRDMRRFRLSAIGYAIAIGVTFVVLAVVVRVALPSHAGRARRLVHLLHADVAEEGPSPRAEPADMVASPRERR